MGGRKGRLGLLADIGSEPEIEALCADWILPPADAESEEDDDDDDDASDNVIVVRYLESTCKGTRCLMIQGSAVKFSWGAATRLEKKHQVSLACRHERCAMVLIKQACLKINLCLDCARCSGLQPTWKHM